MTSTSVSKTLNSCGRLQTVCQTLVINGTKIAELQTRIQELLKQQLATNSARAQQACLLVTLQPRDEGRSRILNLYIKRRLECDAGGGPELWELGREGTPNNNFLRRDGERKGAADWDWDF